MTGHKIPRYRVKSDKFIKIREKDTNFKVNLGTNLR